MKCYWIVVSSKHNNFYIIKLKCLYHSLTIIISDEKCYSSSISNLTNMNISPFEKNLNKVLHVGGVFKLRARI